MPSDERAIGRAAGWGGEEGADPLTAPGHTSPTVCAGGDACGGGSDALVGAVVRLAEVLAVRLAASLAALSDASLGRLVAVLVARHARGASACVLLLAEHEVRQRRARRRAEAWEGCLAEQAWVDVVAPKAGRAGGPR